MISRSVQVQARQLLDIASAAQPKFTSEGNFLRIIQEGNQFSLFKASSRQLSSSTIRNR